MIKPSLQTYRLSNLKLALDHNSGALRAKIILLLEISNEELVNLHVYRRGYDARNKSNIHFIYTLDLTFSESVDIDKLLNKFKLQLTPDMTYRKVFSQKEGLSYTIRSGYKRPVVIGTGPCGLFAALTLAKWVCVH